MKVFRSYALFLGMHASSILEQLTSTLSESSQKTSRASKMALHIDVLTKMQLNNALTGLKYSWSQNMFEAYPDPKLASFWNIRLTMIKNYFFMDISQGQLVRVSKMCGFQFCCILWPTLKSIIHILIIMILKNFSLPKPSQITDSLVYSEDIGHIWNCSSCVIILLCGRCSDLLLLHWSYLSYCSGAK